MSGIPKTALRFDNSLGELRKAVTLVTVVDHSERIRISKGKGCIRQKPRETRHRLLVADSTEFSQQ